MIRSRNIRRVLWYGGIILFVVGVVMFRTPTPLVGWGAVALAAVSVVLAFHKLTCPACGKSMREISTGLKNCPFCGASYDEEPTAQQRSPRDSSKDADGLTGTRDS